MTPEAIATESGNWWHVVRRDIRTTSRGCSPPTRSSYRDRALNRAADGAAQFLDITEGDLIQIMHASGTESPPQGAVRRSLQLLPQDAGRSIDRALRSQGIATHALPRYRCAQRHTMGPSVSRNCVRSSRAGIPEHAAPTAGDS